MAAGAFAAPGSEEDPIVALIRGGQPRQAVAACAREHGAAMGRLCMALLGNQAEAEETVQEALIAAYDAFPSYRGEGSLRGWLMGIARRMCARRLAKRIRQQRRLKLVHDAGAEASLPDDVVDRRRKARSIRGALEELKPSDREAVLLRYESGLSYREIAAVCGIDESAARKRTSRALARLRSLLSAQFSEAL
ncbi:MAG: sigma-70 family RNA polymerase sigma factor [Myxococcota bacterium]